ncbi:MAG TPA: type II CRISPR-associated endonuclease Cas1 [Thermoguttaceae bacterium]|nr:type II CRISPR-associated endonuclease Cas1 [Thermoguttaceae bacterium]
MINRILDFSVAPARLRVRHRQLLIQREDAPEQSVPLAELAVVLVAHPQVTYSQAVLAGLATSGGAFIACDRQNLPVGMFLPLVGHFAQAQRFAAQAGLSQPTRKRLWQQLVRAKILAQAETLQELHGSDHGLKRLLPLVRSGDPANVEARAARRYWSRLFADAKFRRNRENQDQNLLLNYGYAVLRAIVARAICAAGLHPSLGLYHHNRNNAFCLADDLMEPFRPTVDRSVAEYVTAHDAFDTIEAAAKQHIIGDLTARYTINGEQRTLFDTASRLAGSLADVCLGNAPQLELPEW